MAETVSQIRLVRRRRRDPHEVLGEDLVQDLGWGKGQQDAARSASIGRGHGPGRQGHPAWQGALPLAYMAGATPAPTGPDRALSPFRPAHPGPPVRAAEPALTARRCA